MALQAVSMTTESGRPNCHVWGEQQHLPLNAFHIPLLTRLFCVDVICVPAVTPPGFKTTANDTVECGESGTVGQFRSEWVRYNSVGADQCTPGGEGISSKGVETIDQLTVISSGAVTTTTISVRGSAAACCKCHPLGHSLPRGPGAQLEDELSLL
jgi:hypothetical protein